MKKAALTAEQRAVAHWVTMKLIAGKPVRHETGLKAFPRWSRDRGYTSYGVTTAQGMKHDFATPEEAGDFAARLTP